MGLIEEETAEKRLVGGKAIRYVATWEAVLPKETPDSTETEGRRTPARPEDSKETQIRGAEGMPQRVVEGEV